MKGSSRNFRDSEEENKLYSLSKIFQGSTHNRTLFDNETLSAIEELIYTKNIKGVDVPYIKCLVRNKEIRLTPEEAVRQLYIYKLIHDYGYSAAQMELEHAIHFGHEVKRADIVIFEKSHPNVEYIIIELKKPKLSEGKEQLKSYCNATGATIGVWTNGQQISFYHRKDPNYFEDIPNIPNSSQKLKDILTERWTIDDLINKDKLVTEKKSLKSLIEEMEDEVLANAGVDVFEEVFKLIYTKLYDEMQSGRDHSRTLEFRNYGDTDEDLKINIQALFNKAKNTWPGVFPSDSVITLTPSHLSVCVSSLQDVKLFNSNLDVVDDAFEYLMNKSQKGEKGQFFTPRYIIDMCVKMLNPDKNEKMIDTAAGSCGFPVHTIFYVWGKINEEKGIKRSHLFTAEKKSSECEDYVRKNVFAIDFDEKAVRVARTLNLIAGDGRTNVIHLNTLDYERWKDVTDDEKWQDIYFDGWMGLRKLRAEKDNNRDFNFDIVMANPPFAGDIKESRIISKYELGKNSKGKYQTKVGRDILFIERNLCFLKPGGRMAIILPQGRFNNSSDKYIRDFIMERCRILAVVGLHGNVFKPHTGTKTSVLFVQKWDEKLCPKREDYPIFFATMQKPSKDNSGDKIYCKEEDGSPKFDDNNHLIVDHDLYNHDGKTKDGIAEAFIEFAKRENLSFFVNARSLKPFDEEKYKTLTSGLECSEVMLSETSIDNEKNRLDSDFFQKKYLYAYNKIKCITHTTIGNELSILTDFHANGSYESIANVFELFNTPNYAYMLRTTDLEKKEYEQDVKYISKEAYNFLAKTKMYGGEIVINKIGSPGRTFLVPELNRPVSLGMNLFMLRMKQNAKIDNITLYVFLNTYIGKLLLDRKINGTVPLSIDKQAVRSIYVPCLSSKFRTKISQIITLSNKDFTNSNELYKNAQQLLQDELKLDSLKISTQNTTTKSLSEVFNSERLDAEYFMPKYDDIFAKLRDEKTIGETCKIYNKNFTPEAKTEYKYIELADIGTNGNITGFTTAYGEELPTRARRIVRRGQVIISSIEGSMQSCAIVTGDYDNALCSTGFYVIDSEIYNSETLLMLFKSSIMQNLLQHGCTGTILSAISEDELKKIKIPFLNKNIQQQIASHVQESFSLRKRSEELIKTAVKAVEIAIEQNEEAAISYITKVSP